MRIRTKFLSIFLITAVIPLVLLTYFNFNTSRSILAKKSKSNLEAVAALKEAQTHSLIGRRHEEVALIATRITLVAFAATFDKTRDPAAQQQMNQQLLTIKQDLAGAQTISLLNLTGEVTASTDSSLIGQKQPTNDLSITFMQQDGQLPVVRTTESMVSNKVAVGKVVVVSKEVLTEDHANIGVSGEILFAKRDTTGEIALTPSRFEKGDLGQKQFRNTALAQQISQALQKHTSLDYGDNSVLVSMKYIPDLDAGLITKIDSSEAFQSIDELRDNMLVFLLIFILFVIMMILFFVHSITGPIANLAAVAKQISAGNLNERALVLSKDETGNLAITINHMLDELQAATQNLEQKVHERTHQLEVSNQELESFSYSVSHDLRAPIRAIDGFSKILVEDYANKLDADGKHVLDTIMRSTKQMGNLIDDLLAFSRLGRQPVKKQSVSVRLLVEEVFDELKKANPERKINLHVAALPAISADAGLLRQVLVNLLSNAIKFTRPRSIAQIEIGSTRHTGEVVYYVKDNGVGFDMTYGDKLFGVFQRLHDQKDFEGTGVGLAIVKRIIERHGGKVWAEGIVGTGATMHFSLPIAHKIGRKKDA